MAHAPVRAESSDSSAPFHKGICYAHSWRGGGGYGTEISAATLLELRNRHVEWISLTPFIYQQSISDSSLQTIQNRRGHETNASMERDIKAAHELGIKVMLKPHVWVRGGSWPGEITFDREEDWAAWFSSYGEAIIHYADFAGKAGVDVLCIGNELKGTSRAQPKHWRDLIGRIRKVYSGQLIYAANWDEYESIAWWDALDLIGINAYFPLAMGENPTQEELNAGAAVYRDLFAQLARRTNRPIIFTEAGFRSKSGAAAKPWDYRQRDDSDDMDLQGRCYRAIFETFWNEPWFAGIYWWKWFSTGSTREGLYDGDPYSPRNKPAEKVMIEWYAKPR